MSAKTVSISFDEILFEHRNKAYGAYSLRHQYQNNIQKAIFGGILIFGLIIFSEPLLKAFTPEKKDNALMSEVVTISDLPKKEEKTPPPPPEKTPPPPPKKVAIMRFVVPKVTDKIEEIKEPIVPTDTLQGAKIGVINQVGTTHIFEPTPPSVLTPEPPDPTPTPVVAEDKPFIFVEQQPEFPNGTTAMYRFLAENIKYPAVARESGVEGTVYVQFVVGKEGYIRDAKVVRGVGGGCSEEALRVVNMMPQWKVGKQNGMSVSVLMTLPIKFKLD